MKDGKKEMDKTVYDGLRRSLSRFQDVPSLD